MPTRSRSNIVLSKTSYLKGCQCLKLLYLSKYHPELRGQPSALQQAIFDRGHNVGALARDLFPGGYNCEVDDARLREVAIKKTKIAIEQGRTILYEAAFLHQGVMAIVDILVLQKDGWHAFEVKSSVHLSGVYFKDAALQYHVINSALGLRSFSLVTIDNTYVRSGTFLDVQQLFKLTDVTADVKRRQPEVVRRISKQVATLQLGVLPKVEVGSHCFQPYPCDFMDHCWKPLGAQELMEVPGMGLDAKVDLVQKGYKRLADVPASLLPNHLKNTQQAQQLQETMVNQQELVPWLVGLEYPLALFDIEFLQLAIPYWEGTSPYESLPYIISIQRMEQAGAIPVTTLIALEHGQHPMRELAQEFLNAVQGTKTLLAYDSGAELKAIRRMADHNAHLRTALLDLTNRVKDLRQPFVQRWVQLPGLGAGTSLKKVLPLLVPGEDFSDLVVADGFAAARHAELVFTLPDGPEKRQAEQELLAYAERDTWAMYLVLLGLQKLTR